jgi:hypothetical protein
MCFFFSGIRLRKRRERGTVDEKAVWNIFWLDVLYAGFREGNEIRSYLSLLSRVLN